MTVWLVFWRSAILDCRLEELGKTWFDSDELIGGDGGSCDNKIWGWSDKKNGRTRKKARGAIKQKEAQNWSNRRAKEVRVLLTRRTCMHYFTCG
jgi:hypothetical protein